MQSMSVVLDVGIVYCTCGHFLRDGTEENKRYLKFTLDLFSIPNYNIRKGRPHGHRYGKKEGDHEYFIANQLKKKCKKREFLSIHDRFIRDERFRKNMIELGRTEEVIREMDKLSNEDHTHHITAQKISVYRSNWWIRSNFVGSDTMPVRHRVDLKEALSTLRRLKNQEDQAYYQNWWQNSSRLGGTGKIPGRMDIKILENLLRETIDEGNLRDRHHQVIQKRIMVNLGLLKSGKVGLRRTIDQGNLRKFLGIWCNKLTLIVKNLFSTGMRIP